MRQSLTEERKAYVAQWHRDHLDRCHAIEKKYRQSHPRTPEQLKRHSVQVCDYMKTKLATDPSFRVKHTCRVMTRRHIKGQKAPRFGRTAQLLGAPIAEIVKYLESPFQPGMSWANMGRHGWHIDHRKPCSWFDLTDPEQQKLCFHYTNLQPLWEPENCSKGNRFAHNTI